MKRLTSIAIATVALASLSSAATARAASPQDEKGKVCRVEQQCHWENFKKICVYVKVCR
jgi:hypothetical protein